MKVCLLTFVLFFANYAAAMVPVDGKIVYKLPSGDLVEREVTLEVPERGQGEVILSGEGFEWKTKMFRSYKIKDRTTFVAAFKGEADGKKFTLALSGTYLKGSNKILYYGDVYKTKGHRLLMNLASFDYVGGFKFSYDR